jgi:hypothetical protein
MIKKLILASSLVFFGAGLARNAFAGDSSATGNVTGDIATAAKKFLATLDEAQRGKVIFDFKDDAQRKRWSNLPTSMVKRAGLRMGDLSKPQRDAAMAVLATALSPQGFQKVEQIVEGDDVAVDLEPVDMRKRLIELHQGVGWRKCHRNRPNQDALQVGVEGHRHRSVTESSKVTALERELTLVIATDFPDAL